MILGHHAYCAKLMACQTITVDPWLDDAMECTCGIEAPMAKKINHEDWLTRLLFHWRRDNGQGPPGCVEPGCVEPGCVGAPCDLNAARLIIAEITGDLISARDTQDKRIDTLRGRVVALRRALGAVTSRIDDAVDHKIHTGRMEPIGGLISEIQDGADRALADDAENGAP